MLKIIKKFVCIQLKGMDVIH